MNAIVLGLVFGALLLWVVVAFNLLVRDRNRVSQSWSDVDVQLMRRHDLIPRLAEMVKGYAGYERALLTSLAELRTQGTAAASPAARTEVERSVSSGVTKLVALIEAYPDLKASDNFRDLHNKLVDTENQSQYARKPMSPRAAESCAGLNNSRTVQTRLAMNTGPNPRNNQRIDRRTS